jgi:diguanylate cyclase (GGDEF)-like protein
MKQNAPGSRGRVLNLTTAQRILQHAGRLDSIRASLDPDEQLQSLIDALCDLSVHDGLTGLVNASFFHAALTTEMDRSARTGRSCALLVIDIDHFKKVNDTYGHQVGDYSIQTVARLMEKSLRGMDTAARIGGEEFAVILPECSPEAALQAARRIHGTLNPFVVACAEATITLTSSAGLVWTDLARAESARELLARADQQMYRAKRLGRQQLCHPPIRSTEVTSDEKVLLFFPAEGEFRDDD